jgi:mono/diheme cytochrome c family protein
MYRQVIGKGVAILGMLLSFWSPALVSALSSADETDKYASKGRAVYVQLCVACHGPSGKGDGPAAAALKTPPADLTEISRRYSGFPTDKIMTWIDGEKASVAHGTREMPVWGRTFRRQRGEAEARLLAVSMRDSQ